MASNGKNKRRAIFSEPNGSGQNLILRVDQKHAHVLQERARQGLSPRVAVDPVIGAVTAILDGGEPSVKQALARFRLQVDPSPFLPFVSQQWQDWIDLWMDAAEGESSTRILLYGPTGTGKDTLFRLLIERQKEKYGAENVVVLSLLSEESDRYVGHLETKAEQLISAVSLAKDAGLTVDVYLPEVERHFATGDYVGSWQLQWAAALRDVLDGTKQLRADFVLAATNYLARLDSPVQNRFDKYPVEMSPELARGILQTHWPSQHTNGLSSDYVLDRLFREIVGEATLSSKKKISLKATDLNAFNGRFLANLAGDLGRQIRLRRRTDPHFPADEGFANDILSRHLAAMLAPVAEAAGTRRIGEYLVAPPDPHDPPVAVTPALQWCAHSQYLA